MAEPITQTGAFCRKPFAFDRRNSSSGTRDAAIPAAA